MELSEFEAELARVPGRKITPKDYDSIKRNMKYATNLFLASGGTLSGSLDAHLSQTVANIFYNFVMGNDEFDGIDKPTITDMLTVLDIERDAEMIKKDKSYPYASHHETFSHMEEEKETEVERFQDTIYSYMASETAKALCKKSNHFQRKYESYVQEHYPELSQASKTTSTHNVEEVLELMKNNESVLPTTQYESYSSSIPDKKRDKLCAKALDELYQSDISVRSEVEAQYNEILKITENTYTKNIRKDLVNRIINTIIILTETGYLDDMIVENNQRAKTLKLFPTLLVGRKGNNCESLLPEELKKHPNADPNSLPDTVRLLLNPNWKNKSSKEQALASLEKICFPVEELTNEAYYADFSMLELAAYSAHFVNRLEKILSGIYRGAFLHDKLGTLYDSIENGEISVKAQDQIRKSF